MVASGNYGITPQATYGQYNAMSRMARPPQQPYAWSSPSATGYASDSYYSRPAPRPAPPTFRAPSYTVSPQVFPQLPMGMFPAPAFSTTMPGNVTWMPVLRPTATDTEPAESSKATKEKTPAAEAPIESEAEAVTEPEAEPLPKKTAPKAAVEEAATPTVPKTRAEEMGEKVGTLATRIFEQNPQLMDQLDQWNWENLMNDPNSIASRFRDSFQQSRLFKLLPSRFDKQIAGMFPRDMEPLAEQTLQWLRESTPTTV